MQLTIITFGYKVGPPPEDCAWIADVRNIPDSVFDGLKDKTGLDKAVSDKILATSQAQAWLDKFTAKLPELRDGDRIAVGCSIGVHRSVAVAQAMAKIARDAGWNVTVENRDLQKQRDTRDTIVSMEGQHMSSEIRATSAGELRFMTDGGKPRVDGRAILFNSWSVDLGGFRERMLPGSVELDSDLVALFDHNSAMVLGRVSAGTMEARSDSNGIAFTAYPPQTTWANDLRVSMDRGDIKGCSYRMFVDEDRWYVENGEVRRDVLKARVTEVTVTSMPAYPETTAEARSHAQALAKHAKIEERAGRVLSDATATVLKNVFQNIELASDTLEQLLVANDPTFNEDNYGIPEGQEPMGKETMDMSLHDAEVIADAHTGSDIVSGGAPARDAQHSDGASETPNRLSKTFVSGFGFITQTKEN